MSKQLACLRKTSYSVLLYKTWMHSSQSETEIIKLLNNIPRSRSTKVKDSISLSNSIILIKVSLVESNDLAHLCIQ